VPVYNWSGVYLGINGGYGFGSSGWSDPQNPSSFTTGGSTSSGNFNTNGGLVGGTLGVNFQTGGFVFGVEGDWDWQGLQGTNNSSFCNILASGTPSCETKSDWIGTIRARAGYAVGPCPLLCHGWRRFRQCANRLEYSVTAEQH
jgi:outer membrane immunogenic protein